jgi:8-oxo-dGTP diphosphatase
METPAKCLGVDGCRGGWICAVAENGASAVFKYRTITEIFLEHDDFAVCLIDIPIGLQSKLDHVRPDSYARNYIRERAFTIFPAPCRQAVYAPSVRDAYLENERVLGRKFTPLTVGIIPKIKETDEFLQSNPAYKNRLLESHPETCFKQLAGKTLLSKKSEPDGLSERIYVLQQYGAAIDAGQVKALRAQLRCAADDIIDAVCLSVAAGYVTRGDFITLPEHPMPDDTGLLMQMVIPGILYQNKVIDDLGNRL